MRAAPFAWAVAALWLAIAPVPASEQHSELVTVGGDKFLRWHGHAGRTYFMQVSDPEDHLRRWTWAPIIETGDDEEISYEVDCTADKGFFRLKFTDQATSDPDGDDFDGDGLSNWDEVSVHQTDPLDGDTDGDGLNDREEIQLGTDPSLADTDGDGLPDGWEAQLGLDAGDGDQNNNGAPDGQDDFDGDGVINSGECSGGTDPLDRDSASGAPGEDIEPPGQGINQLAVHTPLPF